MTKAQKRTAKARRDKKKATRKVLSRFKRRRVLKHSAAKRGWGGS